MGSKRRQHRPAVDVRRPGQTEHLNVPYGNYFYLLNRKSGRCLAVAGGNDGTDVEGQQLILFDCLNRPIFQDDRIWYTTRVA